MTEMVGSWGPVIGAIVAVLVALLPIVRMYTNHSMYRSAHRKSQIDALKHISSYDVAKLTPEEELVLDATLRHVYEADIPVELFMVLREARKPSEAFRLYRDMRPFIELEDTTGRLRYKRKRILYSERTGTIPTWRVTMVYLALYSLFGTIGLLLVFAGAFFGARGAWYWAFLAIPVGLMMLGAAWTALIVEERYKNSVGRFRKAVGDLLTAD